MKTINQSILFCVLLAVACWIIPARADVKQIKAYKEAFPDTKTKCIDCHKDEKPKKEDGQHDPNGYGKAVLKEAQEAKAEENKPTADTYKKVGSIEDFAKKAAK